MSKVAIVARYLLAVLLIVFGLNKFFGFLPMPEAPSGMASKYFEVITQTYIWHSIAVVYLLAALLLVMNRAVGFATVILAPVAFNTVMYHFTYDMPNIAAAAVFATLLIIVAIGNAPKYRDLFV